MPEFEDQGLSTTAWAYARLGHPAPRLFHELGEHARERLQDFRPQHLTNTAWAYATLDARSDALFAGPEFSEACGYIQDRLLSDKRCVVQLGLWRQWRDQVCADGGRCWPTLPGRLLEECDRQTAWWEEHIRVRRLEGLA